MTIVATYNSLVSDIETYLDRDDAELIAQIPNFITLGELRCARETKHLGMKTSVVGVMLPSQCVYLKPANWLETISINFGTATLYSTVSRQSVAGTKTITLAAAHDFAVGDQITVANIGNNAYNGNWTVSATTQYSITYVAGSDSETLTADTGGFVMAPLENRTPILPRSLEYCNMFWSDRTKVGQPRFYADYNYNNFLIVPSPQIAYPFELTMYAQPEFLSSTNQSNWWTAYARDMILYASLLESAPYLKTDERLNTWQERYDRAAKALISQSQMRVNDGSVKRMDQ